PQLVVFLDPNPLDGTDFVVRAPYRERQQEADRPQKNPFAHCVDHWTIPLPAPFTEPSPVITLLLEQVKDTLKLGIGIVEMRRETQVPLARTIAAQRSKNIRLE